MITVFSGASTWESPAEVDDRGRLRVPMDAPVLGWTRKPHGWCRDDACVPGSRTAELEDGGRLDIVGFLELLDFTVVADRESGLVAAVPSPSGRVGDEAPDFALADADGTVHRLSDHRGRKVALVMWASWCGCRHDLPAWQERHRAFADADLTVITVAMDHSVEDARPWIAAAAPEHPSLIDSAGEVAAAYDVVNVPTVVWIDEEGRVARPQDSQVATDLFQSMNGLSAEASLDALRRWVLDGDPGGAGRELRRPDAAQQRARCHARLAIELLRRGAAGPAETHYRRAAELAPHDVTIRRGLMGPRGEDPFGDAYFALRAELTEAGIPVYRPLDTEPARS